MININNIIFKKYLFTHKKKCFDKQNKTVIVYIKYLVIDRIGICS